MPEFAEKLTKELRKRFPVFYDESGAIGRRYRRQDEVGTPFCITVDGDTIKDGTVTDSRPRHAAAGARRGRARRRHHQRSASRREHAPLSLDRLRRDGEAFMEELSREYYLAHSGHKATRRAAAGVREARRASSGRDALELALEEFRERAGGERGAAVGAAAARLAGRVAERAPAGAARRAGDRVGGQRGRAASTDTRTFRSKRVAIEMGNSTDQARAPRDRGGAREARGSASWRRCGASDSSASATSPNSSGWRRTTTRRSSC